MIVRVLLALAVILLVAGTAAAQPFELVEDDTIALLDDDAVFESVDVADVPRVQPAALSHGNDGTPPSVPPARVFRPPR